MGNILRGGRDGRGLGRDPGQAVVRARDAVAPVRVRAVGADRWVWGKAHSPRVARTQALEIELWAAWEVPSCRPRAAVVVGAVSVGCRTRAWSWGRVGGEGEGLCAAERGPCGRKTT